MQNRYVGDVGDYAKYALLRHLCRSDGHQAIRLAVVWCLFPDEAHNNDGRHISYLRDPGLAGLDPGLYELLQSVVAAGRRKIEAVSESGCLPSSTVFFPEPIALAGEIPARPAERVGHREAWLQECLFRTKSSELVFFDPDNGLEVCSIPKSHLKAGKYIFWDELLSFWERGQTLLVYHHLNHLAPTARQIQVLKARFSTALYGATAVPLVFRRGSSRVFWLVHRGDATGIELERRAADLLSTGWSAHFRPFGWPPDDQAASSAG